MTTPQRIHIVGTAGSGKTYLAQELSTRLGIPHIELDALFWRSGWQESENEDFRGRVREALSGEAWVVDGNYSRVRDIVWKQVELVVWLDYSLWVCFWRVLLRSIGRIISREELWNGNRESFSDVFFSKDSIVLYSFQAHARLRKRYADLFAKSDDNLFRVAHLQKPGDVRRFLESLTS
jgi:adenylate kinase family enzyme